MSVSQSISLSEYNISFTETDSRAHLGVRLSCFYKIHGRTYFFVPHAADVGKHQLSLARNDCFSIYENGKHAKNHCLCCCHSSAETATTKAWYLSHCFPLQDRIHWHQCRGKRGSPRIPHLNCCLLSLVVFIFFHWLFLFQQTLPASQQMQHSSQNSPSASFCLNSRNHRLPAHLLGLPLTWYLQSDQSNVLYWRQLPHIFPYLRFCFLYFKLVIHHQQLRIRAKQQWEMTLYKTFTAAHTGYATLSKQPGLFLHLLICKTGMFIPICSGGIKIGIHIYKVLGSYRPLINNWGYHIIL